MTLKVINKLIEYEVPVNPVFYNAKMKEIYAVIKKAAVLDSPILLCGETGTGKDFFARYIHLISPRNETGKFIDLNCAAFNDAVLDSELFGHTRGSFTGAHFNRIGFIKFADHGTLCLDEIGSMSRCMQEKLLKALDHKEFYPLGSGSLVRSDFRLICATNEDLNDLIEKKRFREDLFYRINVLKIVIPPLRERREDIPSLARQFLNDLGLRLVNISDEVMLTFEKYLWPGNIRELRNVIESARIFLEEGETLIQLKHIPEDKLRRFENNSFIPLPKTMRERTDNVKKEAVRERLEYFHGDRKKAAEDLDISIDTLDRIRKTSI